MRYIIINYKLLIFFVKFGNIYFFITFFSVSSIFENLEGWGAGNGQNKFRGLTHLSSTIGIRGCPKWANCTMEEKLWADYPHAVWIRQGIFNNVAIITVPNVKWIRWDGCQTILRHKKSQSYTAYIHGIYMVYN